MNFELVIFTGVYVLAMLAALIILLRACISDFCTMTIPNILPLALAAAFLVAYGASLGIEQAGGEGMFAPLRIHAMAFAAMLVLTFLMFALKIWGAGDSKLATAIGLWIGFQGLMPFLIIMSLGGIWLVLAGWVIGRTTFNVDSFGPESWPGRIRNKERVIPYGIAIAAGAVAAFFACGYFNIQGLKLL